MGVENPTFSLPPEKLPIGRINHYPFVNHLRGIFDRVIPPKHRLPVGIGLLGTVVYIAEFLLSTPIPIERAQ